MLQAPDDDQNHPLPVKKQKYFFRKEKRNSLPDIWTKPVVISRQRGSIADDPRVRRLQVILRFQSVAHTLYLHRCQHCNEQQPLQLMTALMRKIQSQRDAKRSNDYRWAPQFRFALFKSLNEPNSSRLAQCFDVLISVATLLSVSITCAETSLRSTDVLNTIEVICTLLFTCEFIARSLACITFREFITLLTLIDIVTILPSYFEFFLPFVFKISNLTTSVEFRVLRALRVLRILKIARHLTWVPMFKEVFRESWLPLAMMGFVLGIVLVVLSSVMYFLEKDDSNSLFISIPTTMYWCMITLTTVGYGDIVPVTPTGKFFAACISIIGILLLAIPISIISESFQTLYTRRQELIAFVETYQNRNATANVARSHENKLDWIIHIAHEMTSFSIIHKMNQLVQIEDAEADNSIRKFFAGSLAGDDDLITAR